MNAPMRQVFVEVNPFHEVILFPYHARMSRDRLDVVLAHRRLFGRPLFDRIEAVKRPVSFSGFVRLLWQQRKAACHFNTINVVLTPLTIETAALGFTTLLLPVAARLLGSRVSAIVHEADQFFAVGIESGRRTRWFRRLIGRHFIRLFDRRYVLSPEVRDYLQSRNCQVDLLDVSSLSAFRPARSDDRLTRTVCWIGPIVGLRRDWQLLGNLQAERLAAGNVTISMLCDSRVGQGPDLKALVAARGLERFFIFRDYRPDDDELFGEVQKSAAIICLYGSPDYGLTKTSGARIIAAGLNKPYIANRPELGIYEPSGRCIARHTSLADCIEAVGQFSRAMDGKVQDD